MLQTFWMEIWNLRSVLRVPDDKLNSLNIDTKLTTYDRNILSEAYDMLAPFENVPDIEKMIRQSRPVL